MNHDSRILVLGHRGLVGSALVRRLKDLGYGNVFGFRSSEIDLTCERDVNRAFLYRPEYVFMAAAKVGGIKSNQSAPVEFLQDNLRIQTNVMEEAKIYGVRKLLFLGSACVYPKHAPEPVREDSLLTGPLEPSNQFYAIAKIAGIRLAQAYRRQHGCDFITAMPTNLYGPGDNYDLENCHVLPALIRRFHEAKVSGAPSVKLWGTGTARREFLYSDDLADACIIAMKNYSEEEPINMGSGVPDMTIRELAELVARIVGYPGEIKWDVVTSDGTPRRALYNGKIERLGWFPKVNLVEGLRRTYEDFCAGNFRGK